VKPETEQKARYEIWNFSLNLNRVQKRVQGLQSVE